MPWEQETYKSRRSDTAVAEGVPIPRLVVGLTERQEEVLSFYRSFYRDHGIPPTTRESAAHFGFASPNGVMCHVRALSKKGYLVSRGDHINHRYLPSVPDEYCPCCGNIKEST